MEHVMAFEEMRQLHQSMAIQGKITLTVWNHMKNINVSDYMFGSFMEWTTTPDLHSDSDALICMDHRLINNNIADARAGLSFVMARDVHTRPGYVKLQVLRNSVPQTVYNFDINDEVGSDCNDRICSKHKVH